MVDWCFMGASEWMRHQAKYGENKGSFSLSYHRRPGQPGLVDKPTPDPLWQGYPRPYLPRSLWNIQEWQTRGSAYLEHYDTCMTISSWTASNRLHFSPPEVCHLLVETFWRIFNKIRGKCGQLYVCVVINIIVDVKIQHLGKGVNIAHSLWWYCFTLNK